MNAKKWLKKLKEEDIFKQGTLKWIEKDNWFIWEDQEKELGSCFTINELENNYEKIIKSIANYINHYT